MVPVISAFGEDIDNIFLCKFDKLDPRPYGPFSFWKAFNLQSSLREFDEKGCTLVVIKLDAGAFIEGLADFFGE